MAPATRKPSHQYFASSGHGKYRHRTVLLCGDDETPCATSAGSPGNTDRCVRRGGPRGLCSRVVGSAFHYSQERSCSATAVGELLHAGERDRAPQRRVFAATGSLRPRSGRQPHVDGALQGAAQSPERKTARRRLSSRRPAGVDHAFRDLEVGTTWSARSVAACSSARDWLADDLLHHLPGCAVRSPGGTSVYQLREDSPRRRRALPRAQRLGRDG